MTAPARWSLIAMREYLGAVCIIAGVTHVWPGSILAMVIGAALMVGVAAQWLAAVAAVLLIAYAATLGAIIQAPAALAALAVTVALTSTKGIPLAWGMVPARIYFGCAFWRAAWNKIGPHWASWPGALTHFGAMNLPHEAPWYRAFMTSVVFPHATLFAGLVATGEVAVGTCLILGLATRVAAPIGAFLTLNYFLLKGDALWSVSNDIAFVVGLTVLAITGGGRAFGLDTLIAAGHSVEQPTQGHEGRIVGW